MGALRGKVVLVIHKHFDFVKVVIELICINDNLTLFWIVLRNSVAWSHGLICGAACSLTDWLDLCWGLGLGYLAEVFRYGGDHVCSYSGSI